MVNAEMESATANLVLVVPIAPLPFARTNAVAHVANAQKPRNDVCATLDTGVSTVAKMHALTTVTAAVFVSTSTANTTSEPKTGASAIIPSPAKTVANSLSTQQQKSANAIHLHTRLLIAAPITAADMAAAFVSLVPKVLLEAAATVSLASLGLTAPVNALCTAEKAKEATATAPTHSL
jgi:hypothetical protein